MVRILERSLFYTQPAPEPSQPPQPTVQHIAPPRLPRRQKPERTIWASQLMKPNVSRYTETVEEPEEYVVYEVGLDEGTLAQLEELARRYGLEVPEELKEKQVVEPDRLDEAKALIQQKLDEFTSKLREAIQDANEAAFEQQLMSISMETGRPVPDIVTEDNRVLTWPKLVVRPMSKMRITKADEERARKVLERARMKDEDELPGWGTHPLNQMAGYNLYYQGRYAMLEALDLIEKSPQVEHRIKGASGRVGYDKLMKDAEETANVRDILLEHRTMTFEELQRNAEAMHNVETLSGKIFEKLNLEPEEYDEGSMLEWAVEETMKDVARGAIGLFTFPVDVVMLLAQSDEFTLKDVKQSLKESIYSGRFFGEMAGSLLASAGVSALRNAFATEVIEVPTGVQGYREASRIISMPSDDVFRYLPASDDVYRVTVNLNPTDDIVRLTTSELFDFDETYRVMIKRRPWGVKVTTSEKIPESFEFISYKGLVGDEFFGAKTGKVNVNLAEGGKATVELTELLSTSSDDVMRQLKVDGVVNPNDVLNFVQQAANEKGPFLFIKKSRYLPDEMLVVRGTTEIGDDIYRVSVNVEPFTAKDLFNDVDDLVREFSKGSIDDIVAQQNLLGEVTESGTMPGKDVKKFFIRDKAFMDLARAAGAESTGKLNFDRLIKIEIDDIIETMKETGKSSADDVVKTTGTTGGGREGLLTEVMRELDNLQLDDVKWEVTRKARFGPVKKTVVEPGVRVGGLKIPDISTEMNYITGEIQQDIVSIIEDQGQGQKGWQKEDQGSTQDETFDIDYELRTIYYELNIQKPELNISFDINESTRVRTRPEQTVKVVISEGFDLADITSEVQELDYELRQLLAEVTVQVEKPKPRAQRVRFKTKPPKGTKIKEKKRSGRKIVKKSRVKEEEFGWEEWIGYEDLFEF